ncbi:MAG: hypothetical protein NZ455_14060 [Bacteroidia bacterium]|nr:hypothetical protein [Bacteroidia bacterium]
MKFSLMAACVRHAKGVRQHGAKPLAHALNPITRGWAGGAQHR